MSAHSSAADPTAEPASSAVSPQWRAALLRLSAAFVLLLVLFAQDWADMARQWWNSSTYNHVLLVPFILIWLVWQRREELARIEPSPWWPGLILVGGAVFLWVLGGFSGFSTARQLGVVAMAVSAVLALTGPRVGAGLAFPLAYMFFLVPIGDEFVPLLQMITAKITIGLVHLSGISAVIDGVFIDTPVGLFEVAEACSGVKFLIAMIAFGALVANVCFLSWRRRAAFMVACVAVPILANGVRAWATIFAAQHVGVESATGFDHIVYGWFFFALVVAILLAGAWKHFDRPGDAAMIDPDAINGSAVLNRLARLRIGGLAALAIVAALMAGGQLWTRAANALEAPMPAQVHLPNVPGWHRVDFAPAVAWQPRGQGADHRLLGSYADDHGHRIDVFYALYAAQREGAEASGFGEGALVPDSEWAWLKSGDPMDGAQSDRLLADGHVERLALTWYRQGHLFSGSAPQLKLAVMRDRFLLTAQPVAMLILSAEDGGEKPARESVRAFRASTGPLDVWVDRIGKAK